MRALARAVVHHPLPVLLVHLVVTVSLGAYATGLRIENSVETVLPVGDPAVRQYAEVRRIFGSDDVGVVGVRSEDIFAPETLAKIDRLTRALEELDGVERVLSLTNAVDPAADVFDPPRLVGAIPLSPPAVVELKDRLQRVPLYGRNLVAENFRGAAINVFFSNLSDAEYEDLGIDDRIERLLAAEGGPEELLYTGASHLKQSAVELMRQDLSRLTPISLALVLAVLAYSFRSAIGVFLPLSSVLVALTWTMGLMALAGKSINLGTFVLPPLLLVIGSSYGIHVMTRFYEEARAQATLEARVVETLRRVWLPVTISGLTTAVGFGALTVNRITAIRDLGLFAVIGIFALLLTSLTLMPAALARLALEEARHPDLPGRQNRLTPLLCGCGEKSFAHRRSVLWASLVVGAVALLGVGRIQVDSDFLGYFDPDSEVRRQNELINEEIVASNPFYLVIEGDGAGLLRRWEVLKQIRDLQAFLATIPGIASSVSLVDYLELLEQGLNRAGAEDLVVDEQGQVVAADARSFWEDPTALQPVLELVAGNSQAFRSVVTNDFSRGNILVRTRLSGSRAIEDSLAQIRTYIAEHFPAQIRATPTGNLVLLTGTTSDIVIGQVRSLALALGVIFVVMSLMFLSLRVGLLAIVPNVLAIAIFFGLMGWAGISLNLGTSLIAAIALGIAVDSTIHYMTRLNLALKGETEQSQALARTTEEVGEPITYATFALTLGFLTFSGSSFVPIQNFGILSAATMVTALLTNLLLLPALLATQKIITLWDLVGVKLGEDPVRTIPLFHGLRPAQARIVVIMGQMRRFAPGEAIVRRGEEGNEMYVILRGSTEVWAQSGSERKRVVELRRGDVFGEMALVRHIERSADVIAVTEVEVLTVNERFLNRIQRRYPRIASRVFLNLARILSDRLQATTQRFVVSAPIGDEGSFPIVG